MNEYEIKYSGTVLIVAKDEDEAKDKAWIDKGVHDDDIDKITKLHDNVFPDLVD